MFLHWDFFLKLIAFIHQRFSELLKIIENKFGTFNELNVYLHYNKQLKLKL